MASAVHEAAWSEISSCEVPLDASHPVWRREGDVLAKQLKSSQLPADYDPAQDVMSIVAHAESRKITGQVRPVRVEKAGQDQTEPAFVHPYVQPTITRRIVHLFGLGLLGFYSPTLLWAAQVRGMWLLVGAFVLLTSGAVGAVLGGIDADTCYIDMPILASASAALIPAALIVGVGSHGWTPVLTVAVVCAAMVGLLELVNFLHRLVRGIDGLGGGDTLLLPLAMGVPALLSASPAVAVSVLWVAPLLLGGVVALRYAVGQHRERIMAFGPALCCAGPVGWYVLSAVGAL